MRGSFDPGGTPALGRHSPWKISGMAQCIITIPLLLWYHQKRCLSRFLRNGWGALTFRLMDSLSARFWSSKWTFNFCVSFLWGGLRKMVYPVPVFTIFAGQQTKCCPQAQDKTRQRTNIWYSLVCMCNTACWWQSAWTFPNWVGKTPFERAARNEISWEMNLAFF